MHLFAQLRRLVSSKFVIRPFSHGSSLQKDSYFHGSSDTPLLGITVGKALDDAAEQFGDTEAIVVCHQNRRKTFLQLKHEVDKLASGFLSLGLKQGDRIGIWSPNNYEWVLTQYAAAKAGLILVNINPAYQSKELEYCLKKVGVRALVSAETFKTQDYYEILNTIAPFLLKDGSDLWQVTDRILQLKHIIMISDKKYSGTIRFNDVMEAGGAKDRSELETLQQKIQFDDPVNIQFTSGTTGNPKGATLTHHNIVNNAYFVGRHMGYDKMTHRLLLPVPLYHCLGCVLGSLAGILFGACAVYPSASFNAKKTAKAIEQERCTSFYGTPTMYIDVLNLPEFSRYDFTSLQTGIMTGAPCPEEVFKLACTKMNQSQLTICYGCTETSPVIVHNFPTDPLELRSTTVGVPVDHTEVKIVDPAGKVVPLGSPGELLTRGYLVMLGYWDDQKKTDETITNDRWYKTGDLATMSKDGTVKIIGRFKDMIIRGGENIYPREIEELLHTHPKISEVQVIGVPDKRLGEELCAWIRLKREESLSDEEVKAFCKDKIAHFKIPRYIIFEEKFPKTVTGKVQKFMMREESIYRLKLKA